MSVSCIARIAGVSHQRQVKNRKLLKKQKQEYSENKKNP
jgi:hypothetical protein